MHTQKPRRRTVAIAAVALVALAAVGVAPAAGPAVVRSITAGFGLSGGGAGDVTLAVDPAVIQQRVTGSCAAGAAIRTIAQDGSVACQGVGPVGPVVTAFVHHATTETIPEIEPGVSIIDHPLTNGNPNAVLVVNARVRDPGGANIVDPHPLAVVYITAATCPSCSPILLNRWHISHADSTVMIPGTDFHVVVVSP